MTTAMRSGNRNRAKNGWPRAIPASQPVSHKPQPATHNKSSQTAPGTWLRLAAMRVASKSMVWLRLVIKPAVIGDGALRQRRPPRPTYDPEARHCVCASLRIDPKIAPHDAPRSEAEHTRAATGPRLQRVAQV